MILYATAVREEAAALPDHCDVLELGVGKVTAATRLAAHLVDHADVRLVVNLGTAGALRDQPTGTVLEVGRVLQHDLDVTGLSALVGRALPGGPLDLPHGEAVLATGDRFVTDSALRTRLAAEADLVDMEGYAVVATCRALGVDVRVVKCVSDGADGTAAMSWQDSVARCAGRLATGLRALDLLGDAG